jgi:alpha-beta hydrolase superfamily lysophospholipase
VIRTFLTSAASTIDSAIGSTLLLRRPRLRAGDPEALGHDERISRMAELQDVYDRPEHYATDSSFFPEQQRVTPKITPVRTISGPGPGKVVDITWPSLFEPLCDTVREKYLVHSTNLRGASRLFLHENPLRPVVILVHGYLCGQYPLEERIWPVQWLFERGLDVALFVLPFHASRRDDRSPRFPGGDPRITNEGFRQAIFDLRTLSAYLRDRGAESVGIMGMSLGGYTSSLLATLDENLAFVIPIIPLASIAEIAKGAGRFVGSPNEQTLQYEGLEAVHRAVSPLARPSRIDKDRMLILAASGDKITPVEHARRLADHFGAPLEMFDGGHILQFGRADAFRSVGKLLGRLGLMAGR